MSIQREAMLQFNTKTQFGVDYFKTALGLRAPVNRISQCDVLSCPTFFNFFFFIKAESVISPFGDLEPACQLRHR